MTGTQAIKKNAANYPVKKSIRLLKNKKYKLALKEAKEDCI